MKNFDKDPLGAIVDHYCMCMAVVGVPGIMVVLAWFIWAMWPYL